MGDGLAGAVLDWVEHDRSWKENAGRVAAPAEGENEKACSQVGGGAPVKRRGGIALPEGGVGGRLFEAVPEDAGAV